MPCDRLGRLPVDDYLRVEGVADVFAAGDVAAAKMDDEHLSVMSCQHGRPMGRYAGYNVISDLLGAPMLSLRIPWYVTVLDLGPAGAVYTEGWDRQVVSSGAAAKATKRVINGERIYPPLTGDRAALLAAAAPELQAPPAYGREDINEPTYHRTTRRRNEGTLRTIVVVVAAVVSALVVLYLAMITFVARPYLIPSESMAPT